MSQKQKSRFKSVKCPRCGKKRLFDVDPSKGGDIEIKCEQCKTVIHIECKDGKIRKEIRTEQIGA